jgi:phage shock protein E
MKRLLIILSVLLLLVGCQATPTPTAIPTAIPTTAPTAAPANMGKTMTAPGGSYTLLSVQELHAILPQHAFYLVNVHIPYYAELDKTDAFIAYNEIDKHLDQLPAKDAPIVLYCRSGSMSAEAAQTLVKLGYTHIYDVEGGMIAWEAAGYPLVHK